MSEMVVPDEWKVKRLSDVTEFSQGVQVSIEHHQNIQTNENVRFVRISDYTKNDEPPRYIDRSFATKRTVMNDDVVMIRYGEAGRVCRGIEGAIANNLFTITPRALNPIEISNQFLYLFLTSPRLTEEISSLAASSTMPAINFTSLSKVLVVIPPLPEQKKIASILTSVDEVIEKTQSQINKLQDLKKGTMNELLTRGIGHTEFKDSPVGRIPVEWEVVALGDVVNFSQGVQVDLELQSDVHREGLVPFLRIENFTQSSKDIRYIPELYSRGKFIQKDNVVMVRYGASAGFVGRGREGVLANNLFVVLPNKQLLIGQFLYLHLLSSFEMFQHLMAGGAMPALNFTMVSSIKVSLPSVEEQQEIASILSSMDTHIEEKERKLVQIQSLKKSLMQDLLTGKVRVSLH